MGFPPEKKDGISIAGCQQIVFYSIFSQIRTIFEHVHELCTMNVRNEPLHDKACAVKREPLSRMEVETLGVST